MNLSPTDRKEVLEMVARNIARDLLLGGGAAMGDLVLLPISVAEKILSMDARTIKARMPWVELATTRSAVKLSDVQAFIAAKTRNLEKQSA